MTTTSDVATELINLEAQRNKAVADHDEAALDRILSDDLHYVHSTGTTQDKKAYIEQSVARGRNQERKDLKVRVYSDTAVMTGIMINPPAEPGGEAAELIVLQVWAKEGSAWRMVALQATRPRH
jgi:Domain of unknown function (DUF4440)